MKALQIIVSLILCMVFTRQASAQYFYYNDKYYNTDLLYEFGVGVGIMNSITDIGGANTDNTAYLNEIRQQNNRLSKNIYAGVMYQNMIGVRLEGTFGEVSSEDSTITGKSNNLVSKNIRNLSYRSNITEVTTLIEFHPLQLLNIEVIPYLSPYFLGGIGWFHFNPQANLNGKWIDLQPLRTEGQGFAEFPDRKPYSLSQFNVPLGMGLRYEVSGMFNLRVEFLHRRLFTDYLDDASTKKYIDPTLFAKYLSPADAANARLLFNRSKDGSIPIFRGHSQNNDAYMSLSVKLGIVLGRESTGNSSGTRHLRCRF
jgi:hypothetical protein